MEFKVKGNRRLFFGWMAIASSTLIGLLNLKKANGLPKPAVRLLTQDGKLVEVDRSHIPSSKAKATTGQVASWIWKDHKL